MAAKREHPLGSDASTTRVCSLYRGIYVGRGKMVHSVGLACRLRRGPLEEVRLTAVGQGRGRVGSRSNTRMTFEVPIGHAPPQFCHDCAPRRSIGDIARLHPAPVRAIAVSAEGLQAETCTSNGLSLQLKRLHELRTFARRTCGAF